MFFDASTHSWTHSWQAKEFAQSLEPVDPACTCSTCRHYTKVTTHPPFSPDPLPHPGAFPRMPSCARPIPTDPPKAFIHTAFKDNNAVAAQLLTKHNLAHLMRLMRAMRAAIAAGDDAYTAFVRGFLRDMYPRGDVPPWAIDALTYAGIDVRGGSGGEA